MPSTTMAFFRMFIPAALLFTYFKLNKIKLFGRNVKLILIASLISAVQVRFYFVAYSGTSISNALIFLYTWSIFVAIFSVAFLKGKIAKRNTLLLLSSLLGVIFVYSGYQFSFSSKDFLGITSMLVAAALFGAVMVIFKKISKSHSNLEIVFYHNFACALLFIPFLFVNRPNPTLNQSLIAISYALTVGIISFILHYYSLKHLKTSTASFISYLEVVSGILFGIFLLNETLTYNTIIGGALIIGSTCLLKIKIID